MLPVSLVLVAWRSIPAQEPSTAPTPAAAAAKSNGPDDTICSAVSQLVEQLRRYPAEPSKAADRVAGLYLGDVATGEVTLIADRPDSGVTFCGSASWSNDGRRILFDAMRPEEVHRAHMKTIELIDGKLTMKDLGVGNCPAFSPTGDQIAFLLNSGGVPGAQAGVWVMQADGSPRRRLGHFGRPRWSPDGRQLMLVDFGIPAHVTLMDVEGKNFRRVQFSELQLYSAPNWLSDGSIIAVVGAGFGDTIAFLDLTDPSHGKVKEVLWKMTFKGPGIGANPHGPVYAASAGRCVFVGGSPEGMALFSFKRVQAGLPKRVEPTAYDALLQDLAMSPDGRYVLFSSNRFGPRQRGSARATDAPNASTGANPQKKPSR
jgi:hypothetical protein